MGAVAPPLHQPSLPVCLKVVAAWREQEAQRINIPRQRLIKDEALLEVAATAPTNAEALARVRGVTRGFADGRSGTALLEVLAARGRYPTPNCPPLPSREAARPSAALVSLLKVMLAAKSEQHHVAARLVASSDDIDRLALEDEPDVPLHGWRREVFGNDALLLKQGRIALGVDGRRVKFIPI